MRVSRDTFRFILTEIENDIMKQPTPMKPNLTPPATQLAICLYRLAHGCTFLTVGDLFGIANFYSAANFKMAAMTQLAKLFPRKRRAAEEGLHSFLTMNNEMSKRRFAEELSFETEVAQAAAFPAILLSKKEGQARGLDELRINNWWSQGYRN